MDSLRGSMGAVLGGSNRGQHWGSSMWDSPSVLILGPPYNKSRVNLLRYFLSKKIVNFGVLNFVLCLFI